MLLNGSPTVSKLIASCCFSLLKESSTIDFNRSDPPDSDKIVSINCIGCNSDLHDSTNLVYMWTISMQFQTDL